MDPQPLVKLIPVLQPPCSLPSSEQSAGVSAGEHPGTPLPTRGAPLGPEEFISLLCAVSGPPPAPVVVQGVGVEVLILQLCVLLHGVLLARGRCVPGVLGQGRGSARHGRVLQGSPLPCCPCRGSHLCQGQIVVVDAVHLPGEGRLGGGQGGFGAKGQCVPKILQQAAGSGGSWPRSLPGSAPRAPAVPPGTHGSPRAAAAGGVHGDWWSRGGALWALAIWCG